MAHPTTAMLTDPVPYQTRKRPVAASLAVALMLGSFGIPASPRAQGTGDDVRGQTVGSRPRPGLDAEGVRLGPVTVRPGVSQALTMTDNVFATRNNRRSDIVSVTRADVEAGFGPPRARLSAFASADAYRYDRTSSEDRTDWRVGANFNYDPTGVGALGVILLHEEGHLDRLDSDTVRSRERVRFFSDTVYLRYFFPTRGRFVFIPTFRFTDLRFGNVALDDGTVLQLSRENRQQIEGTLETNYLFAPGRKAVLIVRSTTTLLTNRASGQDDTPIQGYDVLTGLEYDSDGVIGFRALAGYGIEDRGSRQGDSSGLRAEGSVIWNPTGVLTVTGTLGVARNQSTTPGAGGFTRSFATINADYELSRSLLLNASVRGSYDRFESGDDVNGLRTGIGAAYLINRFARIEGDYAFAIQRGGGNDDAVRRRNDIGNRDSYTVNSATLRLRLQL